MGDLAPDVLHILGTACGVIAVGVLIAAISWSLRDKL